MLEQVHERAGIDYLGQYRSQGKSRKLAETLRELNRAVEVPAIDRPLYEAVMSLGHRLNTAEENRSVTSAGWVEEAILRYGCAIHSRRDDSNDGRRVGCTCNPRDRQGRVSPEVRSAGTSGSTSSGREDQVTLGEIRTPGSTRNQGDGRPRPALHDSGSNDRRETEISSEVRATNGMDGGTIHDDAKRVAISALYHSLGVVGGRRRPLSVAEVVDDVIHRDSYAGLPHLAFNRDCLDSGARLASRILVGARAHDPYLYSRRVSPGPDGPKTRLVWAAPLSTTIVGSCFSKPIQDRLARNRPYTWGLHQYEKSALIEELTSRYRYVYSIDWSKFDSSVPAWLINDCFRAVRSCLDLDEMEEKAYWKYVNDFIHTRIVLPDGGVYQVHKGIPSGATFTSLIGSMANLYMLNYMWYRATGHGLSEKQVLVMGDDAVVGVNHRVELAELVGPAEECGFKLNAHKSSIVSTREEAPVYTDKVHFLGHYWSHGRHRRPEREILVRMAFPEKHAKADKGRSLQRLVGYILTTVDGYTIAMQLYDHEDQVSAIAQILWEARLETRQDGMLRARELPGELRARGLDR